MTGVNEHQGSGPKHQSQRISPLCPQSFWVPRLCLRELTFNNRAHLKGTQALPMSSSPQPGILASYWNLHYHFRPLNTKILWPKGDDQVGIVFAKSKSQILLKSDWWAEVPWLTAVQLLHSPYLDHSAILTSSISPYLNGKEPPHVWKITLF